MSGRIALIKARIEAAAGDADITWADEVSATDNPVLAPTLPDDVGAEDALGALTARPADEVSVTDDYTATTTVTKVVADDVSADDALVGRVNNIYVPRSGTPDADNYGDGWVDGLLANNGVNHGNESPMQVSDAAILATERDGFLEFDLTKFVGMSAPTGGTMVLEIWAGHGIAVGVNGSAIFSDKAAVRPFTESTLTWTNRPAVGTSPVTKTFVSAFVDIGAPPTQTLISLAAAEYTTFLGAWLMVRLTSDAIALSPLNVASREAATVSQRPRLSFDFKVP